MNNRIQFDFSEVSVEDIYKEINQSNTWKAAQSFDIPVKVLRENTDIFSAYICDLVNQTVRSDIFPLILKLANITSVFKKGFRGSKENCCLVNILTVIFKVFEKINWQTTYGFHGSIIIKIPM